jgi:hypothetical protein
MKLIILTLTLLHVFLREPQISLISDPLKDILNPIFIKSSGLNETCPNSNNRLPRTANLKSPPSSNFQDVIPETLSGLLKFPNRTRNFTLSQREVSSTITKSNHALNSKRKAFIGLYYALRCIYTQAAHHISLIKELNPIHFASKTNQVSFQDPMFNAQWHLV